MGRSVKRFVSFSLAGVWLFVNAIGQSSLDRVEHVGGPLGEIMRKNLDGKAELSRYDRLNRSALEAIAIREYKEAFQRLREALAIDPQAPDAYINFGVAHYERGEYPSSEKAISEALKRDPENARAWYWHSKIMLLKGEIQDAHEAASRSVAFSNAEDWKYLDWQAILAFDQGNFEKAREVSGLALERIELALRAVETGIRDEESKMEVAALEQDTEIVRDIGGGMKEVPVTRIRTEYKFAPDKWYRLQEQLEESKSSVAFRYAMSVYRGQPEADMDTLLRDAFLYESGARRRGQYYLTLMEYESLVDSLKRPVDSGKTDLSTIMSYVIGLVAVNDQREVKRILGRARRRIRKEGAFWVVDALGYIAQFAPETKVSGLPAVKDVDDEAVARSAFYKAQLHLSQERLELAKPWLDQAIGSLFDTSFEAKAAEAQLALYFGE